MRAAIFTPVRPSDAFLARLSDDGGVPIPLVGRLSRLIFSRPRRCSLLLRPAWPADPQKGPFPEVLQTTRRLLIRPGCFRLERELPGGVCTHDICAPWQGTQWNKIGVSRTHPQRKEMWNCMRDGVGPSRSAVRC